MRFEHDEIERGTLPDFAIHASVQTLAAVTQECLALRELLKDLRERNSVLLDENRALKQRRLPLQVVYVDKRRADVLAFSYAVGAVVQDVPGVPDDATVLLKTNLILEEVQELVESVYGAGACAEHWREIRDSIAMYSPQVDLIGVADALADIAYVVEGMNQACGIDSVPIHDEVHASNMTKIGSGNDANGKVMKGPGYEKPNVKRRLIQQGAKL